MPRAPAAVASSACRRRSRATGSSIPAGGADHHQAADRQVGAGGHVEGAPGRPGSTEKVERFRAAADGDRVAHRSAAATRSARTSSEPACPGRSSAIKVRSRANMSPKGPHRRPVCVKPCGSTKGGPVPRRSTWRGTPGERTVSVQATFAATLVDEWVNGWRHRRSRVPGLPLDPVWPSRWPPDSGCTSAWTSGVPVSSPSASPWRAAPPPSSASRVAPPPRSSIRPWWRRIRPGAPHRLHGGPPSRTPSRRGLTDHRPGGALHHLDPVGL